MTLFIAIAALALTALPAALFLVNLPLFQCLRPSDRRWALGVSRSPSDDAPPEPGVSVLIPARDEASAIGRCIEAALASEKVTVEVIVLDDDSSDSTAEIVAELGQADQRVRLIHGRPLPSGWNGKQHACWQLAAAATYDRLVFLDADVRLTPHALYQLILYQDETGVGLLSAFPHQITGTWLEKWLIPMMHFILLCYLPFSRMRDQPDASLAAGCGQLFLTSRQAYEKAGTHESIKQSRHDGVKLPRAYRASGIKTDVVDGTDLAECRMYRGAAEVIRGALKNATEGIAAPRLIVVFSVLLLGASALPLLALVLAIAEKHSVAIAISGVAILLAHLPRLVAVVRLRQSLLGALCHVPATTVFVLLQWIALANHLAGRQIAWRGRTEGAKHE
ncbi:4,4'-diaponeurosporenoate glycosyltransferase [Stieleria maiorica]|uniref:4,4'-diaponeurosporenoate glycosyltransferase n=1 Tax=Stieleria maiorica TaxID=2795974 RepID=A0A5B9MBD4_9BACT|nr:glycosyltransferase family 2 protein [Stieleria maiorica]QEF98043.1 4,4'-diaponeurosporenoate glycosyltransferase [Stieleria maiorica]